MSRTFDKGVLYSPGICRVQGFRDRLRILVQDLEVKVLCLVLFKGVYWVFFGGICWCPVTTLNPNPWGLRDLMRLHYGESNGTYSLKLLPNLFDGLGFRVLLWA